MQVCYRTEPDKPNQGTHFFDRFGLIVFGPICCLGSLIKPYRTELIQKSGSVARNERIASTVRRLEYEERHDCSVRVTVARGRRGRHGHSTYHEIVLSNDQFIGSTGHHFEYFEGRVDAHS